MVINPSQSETATLDLGACFFQFIYLFFFRFGGEFVPNCSVFQRLTFWPGKSETRVARARSLARSLAREPNPIPAYILIGSYRGICLYIPSGMYTHG